MPIPADRVARRSSTHIAAPSPVTVIRAFAHLRTPEHTHAPADRTARRV